MTDTSLVFKLIAKDNASGAMGKFRKNVGMVGVATAGAAAAAAVGLAKLGGDFHSAFSTIRIGTGATGEQLAGLQSTFKQVATTVPNAIGDTATVLADFNTLTGATGDHLGDLTTTYLNLERITGESIGPEKITRVFGDWGVATKDQAATMDELFRVSQTTGIGVSDLAGKVVQFGAPLRGLGFTLDEGAALLGKWQKEGVNVETVMAGLRTATGKWAKDAKDPAVALQATIEKMQGMTDEGKIAELAIETFGARSGPDLAAAITEGRFSIEDLMKTLGSNKDTINGLADETETWQDKLSKLKNEGMVALEPIASTVFGLLNDGVPILRSVGDWMSRNTGTVKALAIALGSVAGTILLVNAGMKVYAGVTAVVRAATIAWTAVQWLLNLSFLANPITWIILGIVALVAVIVLIATKTTWFQTIWKKVTGFLVAAARMVWTGVKRYFGFWQGLFTTVWRWASGLIGRLVGGFNKVVGFVAGLPGRIGRAGRGMFNGIRDAFRAALNWIITRWNALSFTLPSVKVFGQTLGGFTLGTPDLPTFARGGMVPGTGPKLAVVHGREQILTPAQQRGFGQVPTIRFEFGSSAADRFMAEWFRRSLRSTPGLKVLIAESARR